MSRGKSPRTVPTTQNAQSALPALQRPRPLSTEERCADIRAFGREIRQSKAQALSFLQRAGILDEHGELIEPLRA
jgi:hypothetical protein